MIGAGSFSEVFQGDWNGTEVVVKRYLRNNENAVKSFQNEVELLSEMRHPNIILYMGHFKSEKYLNLVSE